MPNGGGNLQEIVVDVTLSAPPFPRPSAALREILDECVATHLPKGGKVLDFGAGRLRNALYLLERDVAVCGVEFEKLASSDGAVKRYNKAKRVHTGRETNRSKTRALLEHQVREQELAAPVVDTLLRLCTPVQETASRPSKNPVLIVADGDALTRPRIAGHLADTHIHLLSPFQVLEELARISLAAVVRQDIQPILRIPIHLSRVDFVICGQPDPTFEGIIPPRGSDPPSIVDQIILTLAGERRVALVLSDDGGIARSSAGDLFERRYGFRPVFCSSWDFGQWLARTTSRS